LTTQISADNAQDYTEASKPASGVLSAIIVVKLFSLYRFGVQMIIDKALAEEHPSHKGRNPMNSIFAMNAYYSYFYYYRGSCGVSDER
jgi:hypothetical protein